MRRITCMTVLCFLLLMGQGLKADSLISEWVVDGTLSTPRSFHGFAAIGGDILVFGGYSASTALYHPGGTYDILASMPQERHNMAVAVHNGEVYSIAGYHEGAGLWGRTTDVWSNDAGTDPWTTRPSLGYERANAGAASLGDYIYVVGGHHEDTGHGFSLSLVERYDPNGGGGWEQMASLNKDREGLGVAVADGKIYAVGGKSYEINVRREVEGWLEFYDPSNNTWTNGPSMLTPRTSFAMAVVGSKIYTIGGIDANDEITDVVEYFDVSDQTWYTDLSLPVAVAGAEAAAIGDTLYVSGGRTSSVTDLDIVYSAIVPEPATLFVLGIGATIAVGRRRRMRRIG